MNSTNQYSVSSAHSSGSSVLFVSTDIPDIHSRRITYNPISLCRENDYGTATMCVNIISGDTRIGLNRYFDEFFSERKINSFCKSNIIELSAHRNVVENVGSSWSFEQHYIKYEVLTLLQSVHLMELKDEREASRFLMREIETKLKSRELSYIDEMLEQLLTKKPTPRSVISVLRTTYRAKKFLARWEVAFVLAEEYLTNKGLNSQAWLIGLSNGRK
ncbi:hypothetical protein ACOZ12_001626 [Cronobacter turicensis]